MNRDKQIEEMAEIIHQNTDFDTMWNEIYDSANALYNADYRKASEVAEEIFEEIYKVEYKLMNNLNYSIGEAIYDLTELKKKYTEKNNG